jgi:hypothetical protein
MKSILLSKPNLLDAVKTATKLGLSIGEYCTVSADGLAVDLDWLDQLLESDLATPNTPVESSKPAEPTRITRTVELTSEQSLAHEEIQLRFAQNYAEAQGNDAQRAIAVQARKQDLAAFRQQVLAPLAQADVIQGRSLVYGYPLNGAELIAVDGQKRITHRLIHFTNAVSAEDLKLREYRVEAVEIIRYRIPGVDDAEWMAMDDVLHWPMDVEGWRSLLLLNQRRIY